MLHIMLIIREIQNKTQWGTTTLSQNGHHQKSTNKKSWREEGTSYTAVECKLGQSIENSMEFLKK